MPDNEEQVKEAQNLSGPIRNVLFSEEFMNLVASRVSQKVVKRSPNNSYASVLPYYREDLAIEFKLTLDEAFERKVNCIWRYSAFPELNKASLYARINQSEKYLLEQMDPNDEYKERKRLYVIDRKVDPSGIKLIWLRDKLNGRPFKPEFLEEKEDERPSYREDIEEFLQDESRKIFQKKGLSLIPEDIELLNSLFVGLEDCLVSVITEKEIKIVKIDTQPD